MTKLYVVRDAYDYWVSRDYEITMLERAENDEGVGIDDYGEEIWCANDFRIEGFVHAFCPDTFEAVTGIVLDRYEYCEFNMPEFE
jgi:hypothetical protein